ncbi:hypothetical protein C1H46_017824 [Malus baccata]|uniref:Uncharacterized protein n=1 Tax=Malus baccata TaxID=106549 RepID=A0A540MD01_MALBA|nr:hypothetical protein C1H46_017824 [Malus baccata]
MYHHCERVAAFWGGGWVQREGEGRCPIRGTERELLGSTMKFESPIRDAISIIRFA